MSDARMSATAERVPGWRPWHVWVYRDGVRYAGRFCGTESEASRYMDVAGVPEGRRRWRR